MKTSQKMFYVFGGVALIVFVSIGFFVFSFTKKTVINIQENNIQSMSKMLTEDIETIISVSILNNLKTATNKTKQLIEFYYDKYASGEFSKSETVDHIRDIVLYGPYAKIGKTGYFAVAKKSGLAYIHPKSEGVNISGAVFWKDVIAVIESEEGEGYIEYEWKNSGEEVSRTKAAYISYFEPLDMIIWASSYKSEFENLINKEDFRENVISAGSAFEGYGYVLDSEGTFVLHKDKEGDNLINLDFIKEMVDKKSGNIKYLWSLDETEKPNEKYAAYGYIEQLDWIVAISASYNVLLKPLVPLSIFIAVGLVFAISAFLFLSSNVGKMISQKIGKFQDIFKVAGTGDLTPVYATKTSKTWQDEIDDMGWVFNDFIGDYKGVLQKLRKITDTVLELVQALSSSSQETSSTANQQAAAVKEIVSTMEDVDALTKSIEKKIKEITKISEDTQKIVQDGFGTVKSSITKMDEINIANKTTIDGIRLLSERIDNIWDIVNMINGIADQTKIIAFNAELEASAAGEAGKNFQIVATEIRRLADSTVHSTNEIKEKITEIQKSSDRLILTSEDGTEKIKEGNLLTQNINNMFEDILNSAEVSTDSTKIVSKSIAQQVVTFEQTLIAIKQISGGVDNIAVAARETAGASDNLDGVSESIEAILSTYVLESKEVVEEEEE